jgi:hypothetical protein
LIARPANEREHDARIGASTRDDLGMWRGMHSERSDVRCFVTQLDQKIPAPPSRVRRLPGELLHRLGLARLNLFRG